MVILGNLSVIGGKCFTVRGSDCFNCSSLIRNPHKVCQESSRTLFPVIVCCGLLGLTVWGEFEVQRVGIMGFMAVPVSR